MGTKIDVLRSVLIVSIGYGSDPTNRDRTQNFDAHEESVKSHEKSPPIHSHLRDFNTDELPSTS